jgi:hypothetical protein
MKTNVETPLLGAGAPDDGPPATLGELGACCPNGGILHVDDLEHSTPDEACKILSEQGVKTLGSIVVQVCNARPVVFRTSSLLRLA